MQSTRQKWSNVRTCRGLRSDLISINPALCYIANITFKAQVWAMRETSSLWNTSSCLINVATIRSFINNNILKSTVCPSCFVTFRYLWNLWTNIPDMTIDLIKAENSVHKVCLLLGGWLVLTHRTNRMSS